MLQMQEDFYDEQNILPESGRDEPKGHGWYEGSPTYRVGCDEPNCPFDTSRFVQSNEICYGQSNDLHLQGMESEMDYLTDDPDAGYGTLSPMGNEVDLLFQKLDQNLENIQEMILQA